MKKFQQEEEERYEFITSLWVGLYSRIYLVMDKKISIRRVMKKIYLGNRENYDQIRQQFISEVHIMKSINHPAIPSITDAFEDADGLIIIMEYVEGITLEEIVCERQISESEFLQFAIQLCEIIDYLHHREIPVIHKDIKPSNIIIDGDKALHLIDFGIAQELGNDRFAFNNLPQGTDFYAAPEQRLLNGIIDFRTDIYGFGKTLEYCLSRGKIFETKAISSRKFHRFLQKCTEEDPAERFQNTEEIKQVMNSYGDRKSGKNCRILTGMSILIIIFILSIFHVNRMTHRKEALYYLNCAEEYQGSLKGLSYYEKALCEDPGLSTIYESMGKNYLTYDNYHEENLYLIINILEESHALEKLEIKNQKSFSELCYTMGINFFFYMGGVRGKKESLPWFERALQMEENGLDSHEIRRAEACGEIGRYYKTFLKQTHGAEGGDASDSYKDLYEKLHKLGQNLGEEKSKLIANMIAFEIAMEIHEFAEFFLEDGITSENLLSELRNAEKNYDRNYSLKGTPDKKYTFTEILADARKRIHIWEVNHETKEEFLDSISADDPFSFYNYSKLVGFRK